MGFKIGVFSDFTSSSKVGGKDIEIFQAAALQQLGDGTVRERRRSPDARRKRAKQVPLVGLNNTTQITGYLPPSEPSRKDRETFGFQLIDGLHHTDNAP